MATPALGGVQLEQLLAMILLLHLLNDTIQPPNDHHVDDSSTLDAKSSSRVLSLKREKEIAETFAFLAAYTDDPKKVVAVCIEEEGNGKGMIIRMAVNNGDLELLQRGFLGLARILEKVAKRGNSPTELDELAVLREVVSINHNRILCRLRSKHARLKCNFRKLKLVRKKIIPQLQATVDATLETGLPEISKSENAGLKSDVQTLASLFERLENMTENRALSKAGSNLLVEIVVAARRLKSKGIFQQAIEQSVLDFSTRLYMTRSVTKLARYSTASDFLVRAAGGFSPFAHVQILVVKLPPMPVKTIVDPAAFQASIMDSIFDVNSVEKAVNVLRSRLQKKHRHPINLENLVADITSTRFVVHAEIQLLAYYESNPSSMPPRVICSSKKACFLCDLFIRLHGKFVIPSTHGRLYEKWTLPESISKLSMVRASKMGAVVEEFNEVIRTELKHEILQARKPYPTPYESIVFASRVWTPKIQSRSNLETVSTIEAGLVPDQVDTLKRESLTSDEADGDSGIVLPSRVHSARSPVDRAITPQAPPTHPTKYRPLPHGEELVFDMPPDGEDLRVGTPRIHLSLSYELSERGESSVPDVSCQVLVRWLQLCDVTELSSSAIIVDLSTLSKGSEITLSRLAKDTCFHVANGSDIIQIQRLDRRN